MPLFAMPLALVLTTWRKTASVWPQSGVQSYGSPTRMFSFPNTSRQIITCFHFHTCKWDLPGDQKTTLKKWACCEMSLICMTLLWVDPSCTCRMSDGVLRCVQKQISQHIFQNKCILLLSITMCVNQEAQSTDPCVCLCFCHFAVHFVTIGLTSTV